VKVDFSRQVKEKEGEQSSFKKMEYVEDVEDVEEKCLQVPGLNPSHSGHHGGYTNHLTRSTNE